MRLPAIEAARASLSREIQQFPPRDISPQVFDRFTLHRREPIKRKIARLLSPVFLGAQYESIRRRLRLALPFHYDLVAIGERFAHDASLAALLRLTAEEPLPRVLVPGCYVAAEDLQFWLRRGVRQLAGIDAYCLQEQWNRIVPQLQAQFGAQVTLQQASIEAIPFADDSFDLVASAAVLEHVRNLSAMVDETARVLRPRGWAWHDFGPLYFTFGGDHCIAAYGDQAGFDHLLLEESAYQRAISDQPFFDRHSDPNLPFWARQQQFSFATAAEYVRLFSRRFEIKHTLVRISEDALSFRARFPDRWRALLAAGLEESTLLTKSLAVVLRKRDS